MIRWATIALAVLGLAAAVYSVYVSGERELEPPPVAPPSVNPFASGIAATGTVEASTRNVEVAPPEAGLVTGVLAAVGQALDQGDPLFRLDSRPLEAELVVARARVGVAEAEEAFARLEAERVREVYDRGAASEQEFARLQSQLDAAVSRTAQARAEVESLQTRIDRLTVRSPVGGTVLKRNIEPGEYVAPASGDPAMVVGDLSTLHVRAQVDEEDAPRLKVGSRALARIRGPVEATAELEMLRIEPLATPKAQLSGDRAERIDSRAVEVVLQVVGDPGVPLYPGQLVDVFIAAE